MNRIQTESKTRASAVVDLFCGVGGLTHGFVREKFNVVAGIDIDLSCKHAYETNNGAKFIHKDIDAVPVADITQLYPPNATRILVGCAPCQHFSKYAKRKAKADEYKLLDSFARLIKEVKPDIVSMENVPELREYAVYTDFLSTLNSEGYSVSMTLVYCPDYGIPQTRTRLVLLASKFGTIDIVEKTHTSERYVTVADTIKFLEPIEAGQVSSTDPLHRASQLSDLNKSRIMATPAGGGWKNWSEDLKLACHKKDSGKSYGSVYGRMSWQEPAPTMTTQCNALGSGRFGHPVQNRAISLREAALFQTFPKDYKFIHPEAKVAIQTIARHIGNAVPVRLGEVIAKSIKSHLEAHRD